MSHVYHISKDALFKQNLGLPWKRGITEHWQKKSNSTGILGSIRISLNFSDDFLLSIATRNSLSQLYIHIYRYIYIYIYIYIAHIFIYKCKISHLIWFVLEAVVMAIVCRVHTSIYIYIYICVCKNSHLIWFVKTRVIMAIFYRLHVQVVHTFIYIYIHLYCIYT